jgi:hypothetical protein
MRKALIAMVTVLFMASPVLAMQCPALIKQIRDTTGNRFDAGANSAKDMANQAEQLHKDGKHAESVTKAEEAAAAAGITLQKK